MLEKSNEIKVETVWDAYKLQVWLRENDVTVIDIKYAISQGNSDKFLIIYKQKVKFIR